MSKKAIKCTYCEHMQPLPESFKGSLIECERCREELTVILPEIQHLNDLAEVSKSSDPYSELSKLNIQDRKAVLEIALAKSKDKNTGNMRRLWGDMQRLSNSITVITGLLASFYFAFLFPVTAPGTDVINIGLLSTAERGTMFGVCISLVGIMSVIREK